MSLNFDKAILGIPQSVWNKLTADQKQFWNDLAKDRDVQESIRQNDAEKLAQESSKFFKEMGN